MSVCILCGEIMQADGSCSCNQNKGDSVPKCQSCGGYIGSTCICPIADIGRYSTRESNLQTTEKRKGSAEFYQLLNKMADVHEKKSNDYANDANPFSNFEFAAQYAGVSVETVFRVLHGVKEARKRELLTGKEVKNESLDDTYLDQTNYVGLSAAYRVWAKRNNRPVFPVNLFDVQWEINYKK